MAWKFGFPLKKLKKFCKFSLYPLLLHHPTLFFKPPLIKKKIESPPFWQILRKSIPSFFFLKKGGRDGVQTMWTYNQTGPHASAFYVSQPQCSYSNFAKVTCGLNLVVEMWWNKIWKYEMRLKLCFTK